MLTIQNLRKSLVRNWAPVCNLVGDAISGGGTPSLGLSLPLFPPPCLLPLAGDRLVCSWLALLCNCSVPLFCECPAGFSGHLIFSLSLAIPQFKLLSHISSLRLPSGHSGLVFTLSSAARSSPFRPTCWWSMRASGVLFWWDLLLGM